MKINTPNINFKGYAACPLKTLYLQGSSYYDSSEAMVKLGNELQNNLKEEGIDVKLHTQGKLYKDFYKLLQNPPKPNNLGTSVRVFAQDTAIFLPNGKVGIFAETNKEGEVEEARNFAKAINRETVNLSLLSEGGNFFMGKKDDGTPYILMGDYPLKEDLRLNAGSESDWEKAPLEERKQLSEDIFAKLSKETGVKPSDIYLIPQPIDGDWHIDMKVRPLKFPYVLVSDPRLTDKKLQEKLTKEQYSSFNYMVEKILIKAESKDIERTLNDLKKQGLKPISVPGRFGKDVNFMNAVVHEKPNGDLVYITNDGDKGRYNPQNISYNNIFKNFLKENVPEIKKVIFVDNHLLKKGGGVHCMTREEPDFKKWV